MIKENLINMRMMCDDRGSISTGIKVSNGKTEFPKSVDYFVVDKFKEIGALYGDQPKSLIVFAPSDNLLDFFDCNFELYRSDHQKVRVCDGETCIHKLDESVGIKPKEGETEPRKRDFAQGQITACICAYMPETVWSEKKQKNVKNPQLCSYGMILKMFVANPMTGMQMTPQPIMFRSRSKNTGDTIFSELKRYPRFRNIPFKLSVDMVQKAGNKFPIWKIQPYIDQASMIEYQLESARDSGFKMLGPIEPGTFDDNGEYMADTRENNPPSPEGAVQQVEGESKGRSKKAKIEAEDAGFRELKPGECPKCGLINDHAPDCHYCNLKELVNNKPSELGIKEHEVLRKRVEDMKFQIGVKCRDTKMLDEYRVSVIKELLAMPEEYRKEVMNWHDEKEKKLRIQQKAVEAVDDLPF